MNRRLLGVFAFALVVASLTSFLVYHLILSRVQATPQALSKHNLVVASHDLQVGALIGDVDLQGVSWNGQLPDHIIGKREDLIGRGVIATVYQGEPIADARLAAKGAGAGMAATIPLGKRAVALKVNEVVGLAGFVLPGMRVDVLIAGAPPGLERDMRGTLSRTVLQNIEVLSAGQRIEKNGAGKPEAAEVVNLLVTPDQAETLNLASTETKVQLVLRNPLDTKEEVTQGTSLAKLFGQSEVTPVAALVRGAAPPPRAVAARQPEMDSVEVISGMKKHDQSFEVTPGSN